MKKATEHAEIRAAIDAATCTHHPADCDGAACSGTADAHLTANAPTWLAKLLDECEQLEAELRITRRQRDKTRSAFDSAEQASQMTAKVQMQQQADLATANARIEKVRELADEWEATQYRLPPGYPMPLSQFILIHFKQPLRAALDSKGDEG